MHWHSLTLPTSLFSERPYLKTYGLKEPPYSTKPNERYLYLNDQHKAAIAMTKPCIDASLPLLTGDFSRIVTPPERL